MSQPVIKPTDRHAYPPPHLLIVDDESLIIRSISDLLRLRTNYQISSAMGGGEAQQKLEQSLDSTGGEIDLVLLDITMPAISGLDVLHWIRQNPRFEQLRVIMLTGMEDKPSIINALMTGADDYITKPYHTQELLARVNSSLRTQRLEKELRRQTSQLNTLNIISSNISSLFETKEQLSVAARGVKELLHVETACIFFHEQLRNVLRCQRVETDSLVRLSAEQFPLIPIGSGVISRAYSSRVAHCINDTPTDTRFAASYDSPPHYPIDNIVAAPLFVRGHPAGVLVAINKYEGSFTPTDVDLFVSLARTVSQAFDNAFLFSSLRTRQQELLESRNTLQAVIDGILRPIYTINQQWRIVTINHSQAKLLAHHDEQQLHGKRCYQLFYQRTTPCDHCQVAKLLAEQTPQRWTVRPVGADHLPQEWDVTAYPIPTNSEGGARAVIVWQDRTEERRMENSLHQAAKLSAIGQLAAGVAHEINNPLTVISAGSEMLREIIPQENTDDYEVVEWISKAAARATKVVSGLLNFARQGRYEFELGDLRKSLEESIELVQYQLRKAEIAIELHVDNPLPPLVGSWEHLKTVWLNLILNARDALRGRSQPHLEIIARLAPSSDHVQILVRDNGSGMTQQQMSHIFEPFFTTKDPGEGTGLGLATCHQIIERHGGEITVASEVGSGTTFVVRLPVGEFAQDIELEPLYPTDDAYLEE